MVRGHPELCILADPFPSTLSFLGQSRGHSGEQKDESALKGDRKGRDELFVIRERRRSKNRLERQ